MSIRHIDEQAYRVLERLFEENRGGTGEIPAEPRLGESGVRWR